MLYVHFQRVFVEFVVLLTKIWPKMLILLLQLSVEKRAVFAPPPFTPKSDRCNLSCSFLYILILTMHSSCENSIIKIINRIVKKIWKKYTNFL